MKELGQITAQMLSATVSLIFGGFVLLKLWLWFAVPLFGFQPLSIPYSIGLLILIRFATLNKVSLKKEDLGTWDRNLTFMALYAVTLGLGYIVHLFV